MPPTLWDALVDATHPLGCSCWCHPPSGMLLLMPPTLWDALVDATHPLGCSCWCHPPSGMLLLMPPTHWDEVFQWDTIIMLKYVILNHGHRRGIKTRIVKEFPKVTIKEGSCLWDLKLIFVSLGWGTKKLTKQTTHDRCRRTLIQSVGHTECTESWISKDRKCWNSGSRYWLSCTSQMSKLPILCFQDWIIFLQFLFYKWNDRETNFLLTLANPEM